MARKSKPKAPETFEALKHDEATRKNISTAEYQSLMQKEHGAPVRVSYPRGSKGLDDENAQRNRDLDPQLVWRGKDQQDWSNLVDNASPLYIQEKASRQGTDRPRQPPPLRAVAARMRNLLGCVGRRCNSPEGCDA